MEDYSETGPRTEAYTRREPWSLAPWLTGMIVAVVIFVVLIPAICSAWWQFKKYSNNLYFLFLTFKDDLFLAQQLSYLRLFFREDLLDKPWLFIKFFTVAINLHKLILFIFSICFPNFVTLNCLWRFTLKNVMWKLEDQLQWT